MEFQSYEIMGPETAKNRFFRFKKNRSLQDLNNKAANLVIPAGTIGQCYSCTNASIFLGINKELKGLPPSTENGPSTRMIAVQVGLRESFDLLEINKK